MKTNEYEVVDDIRLLKRMQKAGFVKFCDQTGTKIHDLYDHKTFTCYYVYEAKLKFDFEGQTYSEKYLSGCFYPYVIHFINK
jgi:hypothetical protein